MIRNISSVICVMFKVKFQDNKQRIQFLYLQCSNKTDVTGFSTARASDFKSLDPNVFPRGSSILLGQLWLPRGTNIGIRTPQATTGTPKVMQLNSRPSVEISVVGGGSIRLPPTLSVEKVSVDKVSVEKVSVEKVSVEKVSVERVGKSAAARSAVTRNTNASSKTPKSKRQNGKNTRAGSKGRERKDGQKDDERLDAERQQQMGAMEEITERYLHMGGSLTDTINMVNNPQQVVKTALQDGTVTISRVAGGNEGAREPSKGDLKTREDTEGLDRKTETGDIVNGTKDVVSASKNILGESEKAVEGTASTVNGTKDAVSEPEGAAREKEDAVQVPEGAIGDTEGAISGLGAIPSHRAELEVVEAIAMELDDQRVFASDEPVHYESRLSDIDAKMRFVREKTDFIQQEYSRVTQDVDNIRQTLPEMDDVFASLKSFSAAVLSGVKTKEDNNTKRKPFPGGELPELPFQQTKSSENKSAKSAKRKGRKSKRSEDPSDSASSHTKDSPGRQTKEGSPADKTSATPNPDKTTKPSPDTSSGAETKHTNSAPAKSTASAPITPQVEYAAADSTSGPPDSEYPHVVGPNALRPVAGLPPPGDYVPQHLHLLQPAESEIARSETGEERTNILSPIGRLAFAMPHRFLSSKQVRLAHSLQFATASASTRRVHVLND